MEIIIVVVLVAALGTAGALGTGAAGCTSAELARGSGAEVADGTVLTARVAL